VKLFEVKRTTPEFLKEKLRKAQIQALLAKNDHTQVMIALQQIGVESRRLLNEAKLDAKILRGSLAIRNHSVRILVGLLSNWTSPVIECPSILELELALDELNYEFRLLRANGRVGYPETWRLTIEKRLTRYMDMIRPGRIDVIGLYFRSKHTQLALLN
jgi:hypothetical protein